ncbi:hypothetical protein SH591_01965 [Sphingomonas sp. LY54]|uniref:hypothetical protein n=1 Tax=Sphingomonas sp. LY54 TaxID=3095343 RepID=UPI002D777643|nr:hypothetical protein [Sphingomonas sp. LY54]WRP28972.1 hypothetical protein SH591_01965 [Sphingomonas sp. LY54]
MLNLILMLMAGAAGALAPGIPSDGPLVLVQPQVAVARVADCGFNSVQSRFDDDLQQEVVEVLDVSSATPEQLRCTVIASLNSHYYVLFPAPLSEAYQSLYWRISHEAEQADARAWLEKRGLLSQLPPYDPERSDEAVFVHTLEGLCGPAATGMLQAVGGMATLEEASGRIEKGSVAQGKLDDETMSCLVNAAVASGYPLGFTGNEAYQ